MPSLLCRLSSDLKLGGFQVDIRDAAACEVLTGYGLTGTHSRQLTHKVLEKIVAELIKGDQFIFNVDDERYGWT